MSQKTATGSVIINGRSYDLTVVENPTIDDVMVSEMKVQAQKVAESIDVSDRRVSRSIRDFLVRLGVER
jgi:hypothetical protein